MDLLAILVIVFVVFLIIMACLGAALWIAWQLLLGLIETLWWCLKKLGGLFLVLLDISLFRIAH